MLSDKLTLLINTCDKFSDLWDLHVKFLNENWKDREITTLIVTDLPIDKQYKRVAVLSAGEIKELSERIKYALGHINTEYILVTLDDYFLIKRISNTQINKLIDEMDVYNLDYIRLFNRPNSNIPLGNTDNLYKIDLNSKYDTYYQINVYAGIWRRSFLKEVAKEPLNAWEFELSLTKIARKVNANCAMSKGNEFPILDVIRKGKLLHKPYYYFKKHDIKIPTREIISWKEEIKLQLMKAAKIVAPQSVIDFGKGILRRRGVHFYSDDVN